MAVVFILMLSSATLEAKRNEKDKFFDLMTAIGEHFGGEFNDAEKALKLDLNGANAFLERLHKFATREIGNENDKFYDLMATIGEHFGGEFNDAKKALELDLNGANAFLEALHTFATHKIVEDLVNELSVKFSDEQLFNLLFSLAARLEALVHGKNSDGTLKEKEENPKDKIQTFLAVPKCFILPESELRFTLMIDLCFFYSAKIAVVFFILMLSSATLEAYQRNGKDNFFDLMTAIGEHFGGEFNDAEKALKLDLNGANAFLERLHKFATHKIHHTLSSRLYHRDLIKYHRNLIKYHRNLIKYHRNLITYHRNLIKYHRNLIKYHRNLIKYHREVSIL
uniref:Uncharacterized protein n=1 Tax=Globodera rostochiensis TaxID=31243 RepID=A0A914H687_GLORO